jgi:hypothetical protein
MLGAYRSGGCSILALLLAAACTVNVKPIEGDARGGQSGECSGFSRLDPDPSVSLSQGLVAYYPCEQAQGAVLPDESGNGRHATLASNGTGGAPGYRFAAGRVGSALYLQSADQAHVVLPAGLLAHACEATVATWIYLNSQSNWQRIWTFSVDLNAYLFLTTRNGDTGVVRYGITLTGRGPDQQFVDARGPLPTGVWTHVAVVSGVAGLILYINGTQVASSGSVTLSPKDVGSTPFDYVGRSNFPTDPYLDGNIDEFRVYDRALSPAEIQALSNGS